MEKVSEERPTQVNFVGSFLVTLGKSDVRCVYEENLITIELRGF